MIENLSQVLTVRRDIIFPHIPKTAGTSLRRALVEALPGMIHLYDYGPAERLTSPQIRRLRYSGANRLGAIRKEFPGDRPLLIVGHFEAIDYADVFALDNFITFVRDPVRRVISDYKHFVRHYGYTGTLIEFSSRPDQMNKQSRYLAGMDIEAFGFLGISENFGSELQSLENIVGASLAPMTINEAPVEQQIQPTEEECEQLSKLNSADIALYNLAIVRRSTRSCPRPIRGKIIGTATVRPNRRVEGWVVGDSGRRIVTLEIKYNGQVVGNIAGERYRPDLVDLGICATGIGGFKFAAADYGIESGQVLLCHEKFHLALDLTPNDREFGEHGNAPPPVRS